MGRRKGRGRGTPPHPAPSAMGKATLLAASRQVAHNIRITRIGDGQAADAEILTARRAEIDVVAGVVVHTGLRKHRVVLLNTRKGMQTQERRKRKEHE